MCQSIKQIKLITIQYVYQAGCVCQVLQQKSQYSQMNFSSEVKALHLVELQYEETVEQILPFFYDSLTKNEQIRIRQWIKKLSSVINNILWRKNRNLYAKLLLAMLKTKSGLVQPFNKCPPEGSLPKISAYQIPFHLKSCIETYEKEYKAKQQTKSKSKERFSRTQANKQNLMTTINTIDTINTMHTINERKSSHKEFQKSIPKKSMSKTFQRSASISQKRFSLSTTHEKLLLPKAQPKLDMNEVNDLLTDTLDYFNDNFELLMRNHKDKKSQAKQISKLRSLILRINQFQERFETQKEEREKKQSQALQDTGYQIIQRLFK